MTTERQPTVPLRGPFLTFFVGRSIELAGAAMTPVILPLAVLGVSGSITDAGIVAAANLVPSLVFMLMGGVLADRARRRTLLVLSSGAAALVQAIMASLFLADAYSLASMVILGLFAGFVTAFSGPALRGIVPELVDASDLQRANAILAIGRSVVRIAGPLLAGILVGTVGGGWALVGDAAGSAAAAVCFLFLPAGSRTRPTNSLLRSLVSGWRVYCSTSWIWISSVSFAVINAFSVAPLQILGPAIIAPVLTAVGWGIVLSARIAGTIAAGALLVRWQISKPLVTGRILGALAALPLFGLWWTSNPWILVLLSVLGGFGFGVLTVTYDSTFQRKVPRDALSRVAAWDDMFAFAAIPVSQLLVGPAADALGGRILALICALGLLLAIVIPLMAPSLHRVDRAGDPVLSAP